MKDLISVIVPVYNTDKYLEKCINSIINQTYSNLEIICVNDGSTDNSLQILEKYSDKIIIINKKNTGVSSSRNIGLNKAKGKYIMFIDSDDYLELDAIEKMYNKMIEEDVDVIRGIAKNYMDSTNYILERINKNILNKKIEKNEFGLLYDSIFSGINKINCYIPLLLIKKEFVPKLIEELNYLEDNIFYLELFNNINSIYIYEFAYYNYVYNCNSLSKNKNEVLTIINDMKKSFDYLKEYAKNNDIEIKNLDNKISYTMFLIYLSKVHMILDHSKKEFVEFMKENYDYIDCNFKNMNLSNLNYYKKIEYLLLKNKLFNLYSYLYKMKKILTRK